MRSLKQSIIQRWPVGPKLGVSLIFLSVLFMVVIIVPSYLISNLKDLLPILTIWLIVFYALLYGLLFIIAPLSLTRPKHKRDVFTLFHLSFFLLCFVWLLLVDLRLEPFVSLVQILCLFIIFLLLKIVLNYICYDLKKGWQTPLWNLKAQS